MRTILRDHYTNCSARERLPGVFKRRSDKILRVADTAFTHGDDFCSVWHLLDLIPEGTAGWQPKFRYGG